MRLLSTFEIFLPSLVIGSLLLLWLPLLPRKRTWARSIVLGFFVALCWRYLAWRLADTLPPFEFTLSGLWSWLFFVGELVGGTNITIHYFLLTRRVDRRAEADVHERRLRQQSHLPSVDVFIATYNEELEVVERTIVGASAMDYPCFNVWVLDDGRRKWLRSYCASKGVRYITRPVNRNAKAGNLNNGLSISARDTNAALVMVLDADFVPRRDFLYRTTGFFADPKIGLVQTPQGFFNPDPIQLNLGLSHCWADEQRYLYDVMLPALDAWGLALCCGTSSVVRRSLVEQIGGFPTDSVTEDALLSYRLMQAGFITRYLHERLSIGLAPEGLKEYLTQRTRWCLGTMQMLRLRNGPLLSPRQSWLQRLNFLSAVLYYVGHFPFMLMILTAPLLYFLFGIETFASGFDVAVFVIHFGPYFFAMLIIGYWISEGRHFPLLTDLTRLLMSFSVIGVTLHGLIRPSGHRFNVTAKGGDRSYVVIQWQLLWKLAVILTLTLFGVALSQLPKFTVAGGTGQCLLVHLWSFFNAALLLLTATTCVELPRPRTQERFIVDEPASIAVTGEYQRCQVRDLSLTGARLAVQHRLPCGAPVDIEIADVGRFAAVVVRRIGDAELGVCFVASGNQRDALIRKLYTLGYDSGLSMRARPLKLVSTVLANLFR